MTAPTITIFGATGFIGRALLRALTKAATPAGTTLRLASRNPTTRPNAIPLAPNTQAVQCDVRDAGAVDRATAGSTHVVNLVGILHETHSTGATFAAVQGNAARHVARAAQRHAVRGLVHLSAIGADVSSASAYARSKAEGEMAMANAAIATTAATATTVPTAPTTGAAGVDAMMQVTVLRPSIVYGPEDAFFNRFAQMARISPALPLVGGGATRFQPVHVDDVAAAIVHSLRLAGGRGGERGGAADVQTFELGGATILTFRDMMQLLLQVTGRQRLLLPLPFAVAHAQGRLFETLHRVVPAIAPLLTSDQVTLLRSDNVVAPGAKTLADMGIQARACNEHSVSYLRR